MRSKVLPLAPLFSLQPILMLWASRMPCLALWFRVIIDTHWRVIISDLFLFTSSVSLSWSAFEFAFCFPLLFAWSISLVLDLVRVFIVVLSSTSLTMFNVVHVVFMMLLPSNLFVETVGVPVMKSFWSSQLLYRITWTIFYQFYLAIVYTKLVTQLKAPASQVLRVCRLMSC